MWCTSPITIPVYMKSSSYSGYCYALAMGHGVQGRTAPLARLDARAADIVATTLQALATRSRLLILSRLREGPCGVTELADDIDMTQSAVSHQLRMLRHLGLVTGTRAGRAITYSLYDSHVAQLLDEAVYHTEHLTLGARDNTAGTG